MSKQSFSKRIRDPEQRADSVHNVEDYGRRNRHPLIVGALLGVLLGLFIGWVVWPVQWSEAWPPDLAEKAKADYIAAVADAFVAARSDDAADIAYQRLSSFGDGMADELAWAQSYFEDNQTGDSALRINNIQELAAWLQPVATPEPQAEPPEAEEPEADLQADVTDGSETEADQDGVEPSDPAGSSNWLRLALWLLAAFILIAGGIWVLRTLIGPQPEASSPYDDDDEDDIDEFTDEYLDDLHRDQPEEPVFDSGTSGVAGSTVPGGDQQAAEHLEESETDEVIAGRATTTAPHDTDDAATESGEENPSIAVRSGTAGATPDNTYYEDHEGYSFGPEIDLPDGGGSTTVIVDTTPESAAAEDQDTSGAGSDEMLSPQAGAATEADSPSGFLASGREVARYTATYYPMLDEYEEAFRIVDVDGGDEGGRYIGDCGMGVNMKYGFVQHNPEQVAALDVWLIDLVQEGAMSFHSQTFVSKYGAANEPDDDADDDENSDAAEDVLSATRAESPEVGDRFQIVGADLLIDGEVKSVSYMKGGPAEGVFQGLEVSLVVSRKL